MVKIKQEKLKLTDQQLITDKEVMEFGHLIKLLDDEDENIYNSIKERFLSHGNNSAVFLKKYLNDENYLIRKRANEIFSILNFEELDDKFSKLSLKEDILEEAAFLLASFEYPDVNMNDYSKELDKMAMDIESMLLKVNINSKRLETLEILNTVNNYLFFEKGFTGNAENYYEPDNSYVNKVMETKLGIPISLSLIYILISRRLNLPVFGISLPGHFILKYSDAEEEFFIDPFNKGVIISMREAEEFIKKSGMTKSAFENIPYLKNTSDKEIILRVIRNLVEIYKKKSEALKSEQLEKLMEHFT